MQNSPTQNSPEKLKMNEKTVRKTFRSNCFQKPVGRELSFVQQIVTAAVAPTSCELANKLRTCQQRVALYAIFKVGYRREADCFVSDCFALDFLVWDCFVYAPKTCRIIILNYDLNLITLVPASKCSFYISTVSTRIQV